MRRFGTLILRHTGHRAQSSICSQSGCLHLLFSYYFADITAPSQFLRHRLTRRYMTTPQEPVGNTANGGEGTDLRTTITQMQADIHGLFGAEHRLQNFEQWTKEILLLTDWQGLIPREEGARDMVPNNNMRIGASHGTVKEQQQQQSTEEPVAHQHVARDESHP
ncbi:hypothetical protein FRC03_003255 [Tulasnella sp. 419]|nr:hypothetical protein FRC03_003255 [Tulasnella sp. 419]